MDFEVKMEVSDEYFECFFDNGMSILKGHSKNLSELIKPFSSSICSFKTSIFLLFGNLLLLTSAFTTFVNSRYQFSSYVSGRISGK